MRERLRVPARLFALVVGAALASWPGPHADAAGDLLDQGRCLAQSAGVANVRLARAAGPDRYDLAWMADPDLVGSRPYRVRIADTESPRSLVAHDRLVLPDGPADWVAAPRGPDLVLCSRRVPAVVVIERQFCSGPVSAGEVMNGEIEEITFLDGTSFIADDLAAQVDGEALPAELAEDLRHEVAMSSPARHARDPDAPDVIAYAPEVDKLVARWSVVPMSQALGVPAATDAGCSARHADLRERIMPANRSNR